MCPPKVLKLRGASIYVKTISWSSQVIRYLSLFKQTITNEPTVHGYCETLLTNTAKRTNMEVCKGTTNENTGYYYKF
jgi:hypothetical protein